MTNRDHFIAALDANPFDAATRLVFADWLEEHGDVGRAEQLRKGLIPLTEFDEVAATCLANCNFAPATWDKRFARDLGQRATEKPPAVTPKQYLWLWVLLRRYRKSVHVARVRDEAERRYNRYVELLDLGHLKPAQVKQTPKMSDATTLFDETPPFLLIMPKD